MTEIEIKNLNELLNFDEKKKKFIIKKILDSQTNVFIDNTDSIDISNDVYKDTGIDKWIYDLPELYGSKELINKLIHNPISNINKLIERQQCITNYYDPISFKILKDFEDDVLWIYTLNDEKGSNVEPGFEYNSGTNPVFLSVEEIKEFDTKSQI